MIGAVKKAGGAGVMLDDLRPDEYGYNRLVLGRHGAFLANPRDVYLGRAMCTYGEYSEAEVDLFRSILKPGDMVVEVGANVGYLTVPIAKMVAPNGMVWAIEPQRLVFQTLCGNLTLNGLLNVGARQEALADKDGMARIPVVDPSSTGNFGGISVLSPESKEFGEPVQQRALDSVGLSRPDFIKIDVEGMEREVLLGAKRIIEFHRPVIYVEADRQDKNADLLRLIRALDYNAWWHFPPLFNPHNHFARRDNLYPGIVSINVLAVHKSLSITQAVRDLMATEVGDPEEPWKAVFDRTVGGVPA